MLDPLSVAEIGDLLGLTPADAIDAALVVGGFPLVAQSWTEGLDRNGFLDEALRDPTSALIVTGERALGAEFPDPAARAALAAIGSGESGFAGVTTRSGLPPTTLRRTLDTLLSKRIVVAERPLSTRDAPKLGRLRIADPYLRFWLRFVEPGLREIERGRGDLVGAPDSRPATRVSMFGSVKWRETAPFSRADVVAPHRHRDRVPGADADSLLVAVSRTDTTVDGIDAAFGPTDLVDAWR